MARSAQRKKFRAWASSRGLDLKGDENTAYKVWLHCNLEKEAEGKVRKEITTDIIKELEALYE